MCPAVFGEPREENPICDWLLQGEKDDRAEWLTWLLTEMEPGRAKASWVGSALHYITM